MTQIPGRIRPRSLVLVAAVALAWGSAASASASAPGVRGTVIDATTHRPVPDRARPPRGLQGRDPGLERRRSHRSPRVGLVRRAAIQRHGVPARDDLPGRDLPHAGHTDRWCGEAGHTQGLRTDDRSGRDRPDELGGVDRPHAGRGRGAAGSDVDERRHDGLHRAGTEGRCGDPGAAGARRRATCRSWASTSTAADGCAARRTRGRSRSCPAHPPPPSATSCRRWAP